VVVRDVAIKNVDRSVGGILSFEVMRRFGAVGLPEGMVHIKFKGPSGQSFGNFLAPGLTFELEGDANDYIGKGLSGGCLIVYKPDQSTFKGHEAILAGNAALYGATAGKSFMAGIAAERFCVRNSGATAVVEGVGDHGCEYMTRGLVVVLGSTGDNFAAGMSGGLAYLLDADRKTINMESILLEPLEAEDCKMLHELIKEHARLTGSAKAEELLAEWDGTLKRLTKVFPKEYKKALATAKPVSVEAVSAEMERDAKLAVDFSAGKDLEDLRPSSVISPAKKRGFHEYKRKSMSYRPDKDRTMDWEEVYMSQTKKSQQWHNWMKTQTARCMDCGTPTCHSPNQGAFGGLRVAPSRVSEPLTAGQ
jgi:glutamate synthase (NADPH/NADH)